MQGVLRLGRPFSEPLRRQPQSSLYLLRRHPQRVVLDAVQARSLLARLCASHAAYDNCPYLHCVEPLVATDGASAARPCVSRSEQHVNSVASVLCRRCLV